MAAVHSGTSSTPLIDEFLRALNAEFASKAVISTLAIASDPSHAERFGSHDKIVGLVKSLQATEYVLGEQAEKTTWFLTGEGQLYAKQGTPEFRLVTWMRDQVAQEGGVEVAALRSGFGSEADVAVSNAMKMRWLEIDKATKKVSVKQIPDRDIVQGVLRVVEGLQLAAGGATESEETELFKQLSETAPETPPEKILQELKKRKLVESKKLKYLNLQKGPRFSMQMTKPVADLTADLLVGDAWQKADFKEYNFFASGRKIRLGSIHPLIQVMRQFKLILRSMGFEVSRSQQFVTMVRSCDRLTSN
ncbi:phenylalanyl-trna synthetase alpha chain, partial [Cystoisospora suis]